MLKKILVAFDGSEPASRAYHAAMEIAESCKASLLLLAILGVPEPKSEADLEAVLTEAKENLDKAFVELRAMAEKRGVSLEIATEAGVPANHIVSRAERDGCDMIVIGRRGMSRLERLFLGSVSEQVLKQARCPVTIVT